MTRPLRSVLFLPASNARAIEKARGLPCDAIVLDLEDAVGPEQKVEARERMWQALRDGGFGDRTVAVRINDLDSEWGEADMAAAVLAAPDAIVAPKVSGLGDLRRYDRHLLAAPGHVRLWAMIETCQGVLNLREIAAEAGTTRLCALLFGPNDLAREMRCRPGPDRAPLQPALAQTVTAARANGLHAFDGVYNAFEDDAGFAAEAAQGRVFGFDGKQLIHPRQIELAHAAYAPTPAEAAWARAVVTAFEAPENAGRGAIKVEGRMVERLHLDEARRTLAAVHLSINA